MTTRSLWFETKPLAHSERTQDSATQTLTCARDKSLTHRAIMFAAMAKGKSSILNPLLGEDCVSTIECFRKLGVKIEIENQDVSLIRIDSPGQAYWKSPESALDCGNSGTTARLLCGLFSSCRYNCRTDRRRKPKRSSYGTGCQTATIAWCRYPRRKKR